MENMGCKTIHPVKWIADAYHPARGYNYAALRDEDGYIDESIGFEHICCNACRITYLPKLKTEFGEKVELISISCVEEDSFPHCCECGEIVETALIFSKQEIEHFLSLSDSDFQEKYNTPYYAYQIWALIDNFHFTELGKKLIERTLKMQSDYGASNR